MTYTALQMMELILFATMVCTPLLLNSYASTGRNFARNADALYMAVVLCLVWILTNTIQVLVGPPESKALNPLIDLIAATIVMRSFVQHRTPWKAAFVGLLLAQVLLGSAFWIAWVTGDMTLSGSPGVEIFNRYQWLNSYLWLGQLVAVGWPGGSHVAHRLVDRLRHRGRVPARVGTRQP